ncbi:DUF3577 domain-containing protein [Paraburkholderia tropica]|uniref:DUF3577 domain-containing protein n=1 Tax=Paraburkholderia tropica TaxID=92647 RepID=UPI002AB688C5|nr:DUF3577 domain-containing protein [Paraburkholderia tropica]
MTSQANDSGFFNLHTSGLGYLSRVREVTPQSRGRKADPFLACSIAALHGNANEPGYTYFDVRVVGEEAIALIEDLADAANDPDRKVLIVFNVGDIYADPFLYEKGQRKGQPGASIKGRLLKIRWAKVDGEVVFRSDDGQPETDTRSGAAGHDAPDDDVQAHSHERLPARASRHPAQEETGSSHFPRQSPPPSRDTQRSSRFARTGTGR